MAKVKISVDYQASQSTMCKLGHAIADALDRSGASRQMLVLAEAVDFLADLQDYHPMNAQIDEAENDFLAAARDLMEAWKHFDYPELYPKQGSTNGDASV